MAVPVTILSGTLGAGKTTVLNHVLTADHGYEAAVLVNDMGEVNVDADLIERRVGDDSEVVELSNGCICCGMQGELERAVTDLALNEEFDYLLVEPSGISEPAPVARQFVRGPAAGFYSLDSVATVVDARQFYDAFGRGVAERRGDEDESRPLSDLIVEGVEFCDTLILNKTDLVTEDELDDVIATIRTLQPGAALFTTEFGRLDPGEFLDTGRFDAERVANSAGWKRALEHHATHTNDNTTHTADDDHDGYSHEGHDHADHADHDDHEHDHSHAPDRANHDHLHPPDAYDIDSFVYHRRRPMHPERLAETLSNLPEDVVRAKGLLWVAGRPDHALNLSVAGSQSYVDVSGRWIASLSEVRQEAYRNSRDLDWHDEHGDRETQLVVIGRGLDRDRVETLLDECLLSGDEMNATFDATYDTPENPFPAREGVDLRL